MNESEARLFTQLRQEFESLRYRIVSLEAANALSPASSGYGVGLVTSAELRFGNGLDPGSGFSGVRIGFPPFTYGGENWHIVGVANDVLQVGISATDGKLYTGGGAVVLDISGITIIDVNGFKMSIYSDDTSGAAIQVQKSRGDTVGDYTIVQVGDNLGTILAAGADGALGFYMAAAIKLEVDATPAAGNIPSRISFQTVASGAGDTLTTRLSIKNDSTHQFYLTGSRASAAGVELNLIDFQASGNVVLTGNTHITIATGFNWANLDAPTYSAALALTIDYAATLYLAGAPVGGGAGPATITNAYTLWIDSGTVRFDGITVLNLIPYSWPAADAAVSGYVLSSNGAGTLSWIAQASGAIASGIIGYFNGAVAAIPAGWSEFTAARGFCIVGVPSGGTVGGTVGTAFTNQQDKTHTHTGPSHAHELPIGKQSGANALVSHMTPPFGTGTDFTPSRTTGALSGETIAVPTWLSNTGGTSASGTAATSNVMAYIQQPAVVSA